MKVLASLFRVVFSIILLLLIACYLQTAPTISLSNFCQTADSAKLLTLLSELNVYTVSLVVILLLGILSFTRILEAVWNILFCAAIIILLAGGLYIFCGPAIALPQALQHNVAVNQALLSIKAYEVPLAITVFIFIAGWLCSLASVRVAITTVVSYGLWYGLTVFFTYIVQLWANSTTPAMPEALHMIQGTPWIIAAVPGAFFLIYALLMALFETFISQNEKSADKAHSEALKTDGGKAEEAPKEEQANSGDNTSPAEPAAKSQPILKTAAPASEAPMNKLKLATAVPTDKAGTEAKEAPAKDAEQTVNTESEAVKEVKSEPEKETKSTAETEQQPEPEAVVQPAPEPEKAEAPAASETKTSTEQPKEAPLP